MQRYAEVAFVPPADLTDPDAFGASLREYVAGNSNAWVGGRRCSIGMVMAALKDSYALHYKWVQQRLAEQRHELRALRAAAEFSVGAERSLGPLWPQNAAVADSAQRREAALPPYMHIADPWIGAVPVPARVAQGNGFVYHRDTEDSP
jgi:hypothetical protein